LRRVEGVGKSLTTCSGKVIYVSKKQRKKASHGAPTTEKATSLKPPLRTLFALKGSVQERGDNLAAKEGEVGKFGRQKQGGIVRQRRNKSDQRKKQPG